MSLARARASFSVRSCSWFADRYPGFCDAVWTKASYCSIAVMSPSAAGRWDAENGIVLSAARNFSSPCRRITIWSGRTFMPWDLIVSLIADQSG